MYMKNVYKTNPNIEIGINHNGDLDIAKKLIDMSKKANFDCVKFQKRYKYCLFKDVLTLQEKVMG